MPERIREQGNKQLRGDYAFCFRFPRRTTQQRIKFGEKPELRCSWQFSRSIGNNGCVRLLRV